MNITTVGIDLAKLLLEILQLPVKIDRIPEERDVQVFAPNCPNQSLREGM